MRAFDNWNSYLNNDGNLLHGKIRFCRKGTTDNIVIYDRDNHPVRNPEFTDLLGRTEYQVFVDNADNVTAYFYQYIGTGDMMGWPEEDYDPSRWSYQYSSDNLDPVNTVDLEASTADGVATIADLRSKVPSEVPTVNGARMIWVYGYYEAGDTSPVLYVWDSSSLKNDDGGSVIMADTVSGHGRWILASRDYIFDVRHFGVFGQPSKYSTDFSYTSQISNCATYLTNEGLHAWFPDISGGMAYYLFDGSNTFSITGDIYCSDAVRFLCKTGTTGTVIQCNQLHKAAPYLFESDVQSGYATLTADYINISWVGGNCTGNARVGWVIDSDSFARTITGKEVHFETNGNYSLTLDNCQITSNKKITGGITIQNSILKTEYFADDYDWSNLRSYYNTILLQNCKDANTYITLKNKQHDPNYGDLGEQTINANILAGGILENCAGSVTAISHGNFEMHNVSLTMSGFSAEDSLNCVDSWLTFSSNTVLASLQLRRGSISGNSVQLLRESMINLADVNSTITSLGTVLTVSDSKVNAAITASDINILNNQVYAEIDQTDASGVVHVYCVGNTFHNNARHYVHANTANSIVSGEWRNNGSSYDTMHWIRLNRTNLVADDYKHPYKYVGNAEPYLSKYSGANYRMQFAGYKGDQDDGRGIFETQNIPFMFWDTATNELTVVNRSVSWKMFTVGKINTKRVARIATNLYSIGYSEAGDYSAIHVSMIPVWGPHQYSYLGAYCFDDTGEATYTWSFENPDTDHTQSGFSNGMTVGIWASTPNGSANAWFADYPSTPYNTIRAYVFIENDYCCDGQEPVTVGYIPS